MRYAHAMFLRSFGVLVHTEYDSYYDAEIVQFGVMDDFGNWVRVNPVSSRALQYTYLAH